MEMEGYFNKRQNLISSYITYKEMFLIAIYWKT